MCWVVNKPRRTVPFQAAPVSILLLKPCQRFHDKLVFPDASLPASRGCLVMTRNTENAFIIFSLKKVACSKIPPACYMCLLFILRVFWYSVYTLYLQTYDIHVGVLCWRAVMANTPAHSVMRHLSSLKRLPSQSLKYHH